MRLIDADSLPRHGNRGGLVNWYDIEKAPTIEAIPIEWIEADIEASAFSGYDMHAYEVATMLEEWKEKERNEE